MERGMDLEQVHRPLLFETKGYASSQLLLDDAQRKRRHLYRSDVGRDQDGGDDEFLLRSSDNFLHGPAAPHLRLETLSSRASMIVLGISYLAFGAAVCMSYFYTGAFLRTTIVLPGAVCSPATPLTTPCTYIDYHSANAWYAANVSNVSWLAGSMQLSIEAANLTLDDDSFVLEYDVLVYGGVFPFTDHAAHKPIFSMANQSLWLHCPSMRSCDTTPLFDISQSNEGLVRGGNGYGSYLVLVIFHEYYPHVFARDVNYAFSYSKPAVVMSQIVGRTVLLLMTLVALPAWARAVPPPRLRIQSQLFLVLSVLALWQNPVYVVAQWFGGVSDAVRLAANLVQAWAGAAFRGLWLLILEHPASAQRRWSKLLFVAGFGALQSLQSALRLPSLGHEALVETAYIVAGVAVLGLNWAWLVWVWRVGAGSAAALRTVGYMATRHDQLSFRFLVFESLLLLLDVLLLSVVHAGQLVAAVASPEAQASVAALRRACVLALSAMGTDVPQLSFVVFFAVLVGLTLWVHHPAPRITATSRLFASTAFYVHERHRPARRPVFCLETAEWLVQLAWQAYFDPLGNPSASGAGTQSLEAFGFELVAHLRHDLVDTHALVCVNRVSKQLVVAFRGSVSKAHWKTNLRFHQVPLFLTALAGRSRGRRRSCKELLQHCAARIPILNLALPRVHSGFWKAYEAVRDDLKETLRLLLQDEPELSVYVTGHSMGGALAVLAAYDVATHFSVPVHMYNFGGPRVGNPAFVRQYDRRVPDSFRVVFDGDLVAGIPRFWGLYEHVGSEVAIDGAGNVLVDPSFIERRLLVSSKTKVASHATLVYRTALRTCLDCLQHTLD
ncbi:hypothetical protein ACHHYP_09435 [Achlya hypogyna]|uniref:Fungal lipase-type domain-containing protein n=1 Tax=Achlya hypogyna TaxID=1202772 RepID=A0A1V9ZIX8_ACHHY|nr:hypothetical protein ACHHYP_09435 [Achlya hypogyna]